MESPELATLIGAYYHEDFDTVWGALDEYLENSTPSERQRVVGEIDLVLASAEGDAEVERFLDTLGNCVDRSKEPGGYRGWLEEIARRVRVHLGE